MKHDFKVILIFVLVFFLMGVADVRGETLQDAVKSVLQNNPDITSVGLQSISQRPGGAAGNGRFFPEDRFISVRRIC